MRDEFVDTCGLCDAPLRMGQRCACGDNWRAAQPAPAQPSDAELERRTGEPHVDGWPLYSGLPPAAKPAPRDAVTDEMVEAAWEVLYGDTLNAEDGKRVRAALVAAMGVRDE